MDISLGYLQGRVSQECLEIERIHSCPERKGQDNVPEGRETDFNVGSLD
jgi:hypothetical protein